ncbi:MAG: hypothetical protein RIC19_11305 [Phaeodactylibacter sp.]|uniref:hypothetical protein n=1 Tax=Phaeodactylibacter sp. TaxID=1940289 RepID=UPI0032EE1035
MNKNKAIYTLVGFIIAGLGFSSIILSLVGAKLSFLVWIDAWGALTGFLIKLIMILSGIVIIYLARTDFSGEEPV